MHISEVNIYPVKSLGGISLGSALVEERGFQYDRRWMLVDDDRQFITQREVPQMATVKLEVRDDGLVASRNGGSIKVPFEPATGDTAIARPRAKPSTPSSAPLATAWIARAIRPKTFPH